MTSKTPKKEQNLDELPNEPLDHTRPWKDFIKFNEKKFHEKFLLVQDGNSYLSKIRIINLKEEKIFIILDSLLQIKDGAWNEVEKGKILPYVATTNDSPPQYWGPDIYKFEVGIQNKTNQHPQKAFAMLIPEELTEKELEKLGLPPI